MLPRSSPLFRDMNYNHAFASAIVQPMKLLRLILLCLPVLLAAFACSDGGESLPFGLKSEVLASADRPSAIAVAPDGRVFFAEQYTGAIRVISADGTLQAEPVAVLPVSTYLDLDWGVTGLAVDPDFEENHVIYAFYSAATQDETITQPALVRLTEQDGKAVEQEVVTEDFPETDPAHPGYNANGAIHFGADGLLYVSLGDYDTAPRAQDLSNPIGKLLRINPADGGAAEGNPLAAQAGADPRIFAYGFREPFPFALHPEAGVIYGTDNTPYTCEELNVIEPGVNYSWPDVGQFPFADCAANGQTPGIHYFARPDMNPGDYLSFVEVSGLAFAQGDTYPNLGDSLIVCESQRSDVNGVDSAGVLRRLTLTGSDFKQVASDDVLINACRGDVAASPDGVVYYTTEKEIRRLDPGDQPRAAAPSR